MKQETQQLKEVQAVISTKDLMVFNIFRRVPLTSLSNAFLGFGKTAYQFRNDILKDRFFYYFSDPELRQFLITHFSQDKAHPNYSEIYQKSIRFQKSITKAHQVLSDNSLSEFLNDIWSGEFTSRIRQNLKILSLIFSGKLGASFFKTTEDFNFWKQVNNFVTEKIFLEKNYKSKQRVCKLMGFLLFGLSAEKVIPVKLNIECNIQEVEFTVITIVKSFNYAGFSKEEIEELARVNPKLLQLIIDGIQDSKTLSSSFDPINSSTLEFFLAFAADKIFKKELLVNLIKKFEIPAAADLYQYKQHIEQIMQESKDAQECNNPRHP